jgi:hypothetical protein
MTRGRGGGGIGGRERMRGPELIVRVIIFERIVKFIIQNIAKIFFFMSQSIIFLAVNLITSDTVS